MISTPRCGEPMRDYEPGRAPDALDVVPRAAFARCFRPRGHAEREERAGKMVRHASEASWRRDLARGVQRKRAWRRARRRANVRAG
jgi:hypothetical protein